MKKFGDARGIVNDMPNPDEGKGKRIRESIKADLSTFFYLMFKSIVKFAFDSFIIYWLSGYLGWDITYSQAMAALVIVRIALPKSATINNTENVKNGNEKK